MRINQYCTCDVDNFGDVLYPLLFRHVVDRCAGAASARAYAFISGQAALGGGYEVDSVKQLYVDDVSRCPLVIGGGDILRFDDRVLASHYLKQMTTYFSGWSQASQQGPYQVRYRFGSAAARRADPVNDFVIERMPPVRGAFFLSPLNCPGADSVAFFSAGIPFDFCAEERQHVQEIFNQSSFVYLRDEQSADKLRQAGVTREIEVAPDIAVVVSDLFPKTELAEAARDVLSKVGIYADQPYLCFQLSEAATHDLVGIASQLEGFAKRHDLPVVLLPLGFCHGDAETLSLLAKASPHRFRFAHAKTVKEMLAVISHAVAFAGVSMHGNICAFAYGVPHLFGVLNVDKIDGAMVSMNLDPAQRIRNWNELTRGLEGLLALDRSVLVRKQSVAGERAYLTSSRLINSLSDN